MKVTILFEILNINYVKKDLNVYIEVLLPRNIIKRKYRQKRIQVF